MSIYPDDRVLVAVMNNPRDWDIVQAEGWYRIPVKRAPDPVPNIDLIAWYFTKAFGSDRWAVHYYARLQGHELVTRADLLPAEANHPRAGQWYFKLLLDPPRHKLPPIVSHKWRRITFIATTGDRFENALEINDLFDRESPLGRLYVTLKEAGYAVEQFWTVNEARRAYQVDLAVKTPTGWLAVNLDPGKPGPTNTLQLSEAAPPAENLNRIKAALQNTSA